MKKFEPTMSEGLQDVWQAIGGDILDGFGGEDANPTLKGTDLQQIIPGYADLYLPTKELKEQWKAANYEQRGVWAKEAFPDDSNYGY